MRQLSDCGLCEVAALEYTVRITSLFSLDVLRFSTRPGAALAAAVDTFPNLCC